MMSTCKSCSFSCGREYRCWMCPLGQLQCESEFLSAAGRGNLSFVCHTGQRSPLTSCARHLEMSWYEVALPGLFLLAPISSAVIRHQEMSKHTDLGHLILWSLTCIIKTTFNLSVKGKEKWDHVILNFFFVRFFTAEQVKEFWKI